MGTCIPCLKGAAPLPSQNWSYERDVVGANKTTTAPGTRQTNKTIAAYLSGTTTRDLSRAGHSRDSLDAQNTLHQFECDGGADGIECLNAPDIACDAACAVAFCMSGSMCP